MFYEVAEALIEQDIIQPVRLVLIEPHDRKTEYWFNKQYEAFLIQEILPAVKRQFPLEQRIFVVQSLDCAPRTMMYH